MKQHYSEGFNPCEECSECAKVCPVGAINDSKPPGEAYDRKRCARFILGLKAHYDSDVMICGRCFSVCPWSKISKLI